MSHEAGKSYLVGRRMGTIVPPPATSLLNAPQYETGKVIAQEAAAYINEKLGGKANVVILSHDSMGIPGAAFRGDARHLQDEPGVTVVRMISPSPVT